jgi:hypothetical protein
VCLSLSVCLATINGRWLEQKDGLNYNSALPEFAIYTRHFLDQYTRDKFNDYLESKKTDDNFDMYEEAKTMSFTEFMLLTFWVVGHAIRETGGDAAQYGLDDLSGFTKEWIRKRHEQLRMFRVRGITPGGPMVWETNLFSKLKKDRSLAADGLVQEGKSEFGGTASTDVHKDARYNLQDTQRFHCGAASAYQVFIKPGPVQNEVNVHTRMDICLTMPLLYFRMGADPHRAAITVQRPKDTAERKQESGAFSPAGSRLAWELQKITGQVTLIPNPPLLEEKEEEEAKTKKKQRAVNKTGARVKKLQEEIFAQAEAWMNINPFGFASGIWRLKRNGEFGLAPPLKMVHPQVITNRSLPIFMPRVTFLAYWNKTTEGGGGEKKKKQQQPKQTPICQVDEERKTKGLTAGRIVADDQFRVYMTDSDKMAPVHLKAIWKKQFNIPMEHLLRAGMDTGFLPHPSVPEYTRQQQQANNKKKDSDDHASVAADVSYSAKDIHGLDIDDKVFRWAKQLRQNKQWVAEWLDPDTNTFHESHPLSLYTTAYRFYLQGCTIFSTEEEVINKYFKPWFLANKEGGMFPPEANPYDVLVMGCRLWLVMFRDQAVTGIDKLSPMAASYRDKVLSGKTKIEDMVAILFTSSKFWEEYTSNKRVLKGKVDPKAMVGRKESPQLDILLNNYDNNIICPSIPRLDKLSSDTDPYVPLAFAVVDIIYPTQIYSELLCYSRPILYCQQQQDAATQWDDLCKSNVVTEQHILRKVIHAPEEVIAEKFGIAAVLKAAIEKEKSDTTTAGKVYRRKNKAATAQGAYKKKDKKSDGGNSVQTQLQAIDWKNRIAVLQDANRMSDEKFVPGENSSSLAILLSILQKIEQVFNIPEGMQQYINLLANKLTGAHGDFIVHQFMKSKIKDVSVSEAEMSEAMEISVATMTATRPTESQETRLQRVCDMTLDLLPRHPGLAHDEVKRLAGNRSTAVLGHLYDSYTSRYFGNLPAVSKMNFVY